MTKTARKSLAKKLIILMTAALLIVVLALQLASAPVFSVLPNGTASAGADSMNGVGITYSKADNGLVNEDYSLTDSTMASNASTEATPAPNDEISVIISLQGTPMMQFASANRLTVAQALATTAGKKNFDELENIRQSAYNAISNYILEYRYNYSTIMNAFSATVRYRDVEAIESNKYVKSVIISNTYLAPKTVTENYVNVYETGIFDSTGVGYDGTGTVVAVVDTGTDYTHEVFDMELDPNTLAITKDDVAAVVPLLTATSLSAEQGEVIDEDNLYIKSKLPFAYDYADSDTNVYPHESHGTHVAGIIAGKSDEITGVAPSAQIATFKVFSDYTSGAQTEWILAGLNDAVTLGVDAINMSLGSSCGFSREADEDEINEVYDAINNAGICLVVAASNDYSSANGSTWGNTNLASNPDSGTVGSPGSYTASLAVGSVSGVKTKYFMVDNNEIYFAESRITGKTDANDFVGELLGDNNEGEFEYVVIPGIGLSVNYTGIDITGKIAVVKRGSNSFEDKVKIAMERGAAGVVIYNNVSGTLSMTIGTKPLIPSCLITMDIAEPLVASGSGTIKLSKDYLAGPFMSDFSSWGALPDLTLAPDITAHGGEIYSSVAGGDQYDRLSGTSMAAPNLAGALILVRQYVKENHPDYTTTEIRDESYSRMMSTATIVLNDAGNPYSPRKQGAGIADIAHSINTKAYLTVDGSNKPKLSLGDDPDRTGVYTMTFNLVNTSNSAISYNIEPIVMTESMSSDDRTVAEKAYMFNDTKNTYAVTATKGRAVISGNSISLSGNGEAKITVTVTLSNADKNYIDKNFINGMFVEGYIQLVSSNLDGINLNIPYLGFYGNWADAPMLDISEYAVGESAADDSVLEEDKVKADVFGTLPYSGFASSSSTDGIGYWGMGVFAFNTASGYATPATQEKYAALTTNPDGDYLFYMVRAGLLRGAKRVEMEIRNSATGELLWTGVDYNARKSYASGGTQVGGMVTVELDISQLNLPNNAKYTFTMECFLDWEDENGEYTYGNNNKFSFEFTIDNEAPELTDVNVREVKSGTSTRYYLDITMYDNHYIQCLIPYTYESISANGNISNYTSLTGGGVVPVTANYNSDTTISIDVSAYWSTILANEGKLYINAYDYAKNMSSFFVTIEQETDVHIAKTRTARDEYTVVPNGQIDLSEYIAVTTNVTGENGSYLEGYWIKDLEWESSDPTTVEVDRHSGLVTGLKAGSAVITVRTPNVDTFNADDKEHCLSFTITVSGTPTTISMSGVEMYVVKVDDDGKVLGEYKSDMLALERGETAVISAKIKPYNYTGDYSLTWTSTSANVKIMEVSEDGLTVTVRAMESGSATVRATVDGSRISGYTTVRVAAEYTMYSSIYLRSYTGRGDENGVVEIPDDLGIAYIYPQAFLGNQYIKKVIIPEGVTTIYEGAFVNCTALEEVVLPSTLETIDIAAFALCSNLRTINLDAVKSIGEQAFWYCEALEEINLTNCTYIDSYAFINCSSLTSIDLSRVGTVNGGAFAYCDGLETVTIPANTYMAYCSPYSDGGVFSNCANLKTVIIESDNVGINAFRGCTSLETVIFKNDIDVINACAFLGCTSLKNVMFEGSAYKIDYGAFYGCSAITSFKLPAGLTILGSNAFQGCTNLRQLTVSSGALLETIDILAFYQTAITRFVVEDGNRYLSTDANGVLYDRAKVTLIAYPTYNTATSFTVPSTVKTIGSGAFSPALYLKTVNLGNTVEYIESGAFSRSSITTISGYNNVKYIGDYAFELASITTLPITDNVMYIGDSAFSGCSDIGGVLNIPANLQYLGAYAFADYAVSASVVYSVPITSVSFANSSIKYVGEGVFSGCTQLKTIDFGSLKEISAGMFYGCTALETVVIPNTIEYIGELAFGGCINLSNVTLSNSIKNIGEGTFYKNVKLTSIVIPESVVSIGTNAFAITGLMGIDLVNVKSIGDGAFAGTQLKSVQSSNVTYVGDQAFADCKVLTTVNLSVAQSIGSQAFAGCTLLTNVSLNNATIIGSEAFIDCNRLVSIALPKAETVGEKAFYDASNLTNVTLNAVKSIGAQAFYGTAIQTIALPATLEKVSEGAFYGADLLKSISVDENCKTYFANDGVLYSVNSANYYTLVCYPADKDGTAYSVLDRTIKLAAYSFSSNKNLTEVTLPVYLQVIGVSAMSGMDNLTKITLNAVDAPTLESEAFIVTDNEGNESYVNVYNNFNFAAGDVEGAANLTIIIPANSAGYDNRIWNSYVGSCLEISDKIHVSISTLQYIDNINAMTKNPTAADAAEIAKLVRLYNMFNEAQKSFINGSYNYKDANGNTIDSAYYTALLGGTNYYQAIMNAQSSIGTATSAYTSATVCNASIVSESDIVIWVAIAAVAIAICVVIGSAVVSTRRNRK